MAKSPAQIVKDKFGDKQKLVDAVKAFVTDELWVSRENKDKGLAHVSNAKLLRLHSIFTTVKEKFGTRGKLIDAVVEAAGRTKDAGYRTRMDGWPVPRLFDAYKSLTKKSAKPAEKKAEKKAAAPSPAPEAKPAKKAAKPAAKAEAKPAKKAAAKK